MAVEFPLRCSKPPTSEMIVKEFSNNVLQNISSQISIQDFRQTIVALFVALQNSKMQVGLSKGVEVQDLKLPWL